MTLAASLRLRQFAAAVALIGFGCVEAPPTASQGGDHASARASSGNGGGKNGGGKNGGGLSVSRVDPSFGRQGQVVLGVRIAGSGFDNTAIAQWERAGVVDPRVTVLATRFLSSSELEADISIDEEADLDLYDVAVSLSGGKRGVGAELFEVTTAVAMGTFCSSGFSAARGVNVLGQAVGHSCGTAFYWEGGTTLVSLGTGIANGIDAGGSTIVGASWSSVTSSSDGPALVWTRSGTSWLRGELPSSGQTARANAVASDLGGAAVLIAGQVKEAINKKNSVIRPTLWTRSGSTWQRVALPLPSGLSSNTSLRVRGVNALGQAAGGFTGVAAVWEPNGSGGYTATQLPGQGEAMGISADGNIVVGSAGGAAFWRRTATGWSQPVSLTTCGGGWANGVNASGIAVGRGCNGAAVWFINAATGAFSELRLPGLGSKEIAEAFGLNDAAPSRVVGNAPPKGTTNPWAVYWELP